MMLPVNSDFKIGPSSSEDIEYTSAINDALGMLPQEPVETWHTLHGGIYTRTVKIKKGMAIVGALILVPTTLVIHGTCVFNSGEREFSVDGQAVIPASANRMQAFYAIEDTWLSMAFATKAHTPYEAEEEFTEDAGLLLSRQLNAVNHFNITGE